MFYVEYDEMKHKVNIDIHTEKIQKKENRKQHRAIK